MPGGDTGCTDRKASNRTRTHVEAAGRSKAFRFGHPGFRGGNPSLFMAHARTSMDRALLFKRISACLLAGVLTCCGAMGTPGKEPAGWENLPIAGVAPYIKIDVDEDAVNASQPFISLPPEPGGTPINPVKGSEPCVLKFGSVYRMWYEDACPVNGESGTYEQGMICIFTIESVDGENWQGKGPDGAPLPVEWKEGVETPYDPGAWEGGRVQAPSVVYDPQGGDALYKMWYTGTDGTRIGYAFSTNGQKWTRSGPGGEEDPSPVLVPCLSWEGGKAGLIGSPGVIIDDGQYRMWYHGEDAEGVRRIGHALSADGETWFKMDAAGYLGNEEDHRTQGDSCSPEQEGLPLDPVLTPNPIEPCTPEELEEDPFCTDWALQRNWEWTRVWAPYVMRDDSSLRKIYRMYYTGGVLVLRDPKNLPSLFSEFSTSVGYAGSVNGVEWVKQRIGINPVLDEPFALDLGGFMAYWCQMVPPHGENLFCDLQEFLSQLSIRILSNEYVPTVLRDEKEFKMWFRQNDLLNLLFPEQYQGIGLAANPPRDIF